MSHAEPRRLGWGWLISLVSSAILGLLIFLSSLALQTPDLLSPTPVPQPAANFSTDFPTRIEAVTRALQALPWPLPTPEQDPQGSGRVRWTHRRYDLTVPAPDDAAVIERTLDPLRAAAAGVTLHVTHEAVGAQVQVGVDGLLTHTLSFHWLGRQPRVAVVIDGLGADLRIARTLAGIDPPLTFAVMPSRPFSREVAQLAHLLGREVLLHLPMEGEADPAPDVPAEMLLLSTDRDTIVQQLDAALTSVPHAVGMTNHLGARFTADRAHMLWVLEYCKRRNLFFIDGRATPQSVACEVAGAVGVPCLTRTILLDDASDEVGLRAQLDALPKLARQRGDVIAIGHADAATAIALQATLPGLSGAGVQVVSASTILEDVALARH